MRRLVSSLLRSLPNLGNVIVFLVFLFLLFGILGIQIFSSTLYNRCRITPTPINGVWEINSDIQQVCTTSSHGQFKCPADNFCGNPSQYSLSLQSEGVYSNENINFGITNFDNIGSAMLTIFQIITLEGWVDLMYNFQDAMIPAIPAIYFCFLVVLGSFFLLNLILAVIMDSFEQVDNDQNRNNSKADDDNNNNNSTNNSPRKNKTSQSELNNSLNNKKNQQNKKVNSIIKARKWNNSLHS